MGLNSVQNPMEVEEIVPMEKLKMDWVPHIPQIFILSCNQRMSALRQQTIERHKEFEYCLPYFYNPLKQDDLKQNTGVPILYPAEPKPDFTDRLITDEALSEDQKDAFKEFVKQKVREAKRANEEAREARKKAVEEMSEETREAFESMRFYKFYPVKTPDTPDVSNVKAKYINKYYSTAHKVF